MKNAFLSLALLITFTSCVAPYSPNERGVYKDRYLDQLAPGEFVINGLYQTVTSRTREGDYVLRVFFPETRIMTAETHFADERMRSAEGKSLRFSDQGVLTVEGQNRNGKASGEWKLYYPKSGDLREVGQYVAGEKEGIWKEYYEKGTLKGTFNYLEDKKQGDFVTYDSLGVEDNRGAFQADTILNQTLQKKTQVDEMPLFYDAGCDIFLTYDSHKQCADKKMLEWIYRNVRYPQNARNNGVQGMAVVSFVVDRDGTVVEPEVIRGLSQDISEELLSLVKRMPPWLPGTQNEQPVRVLFNLPVKFTIE